MKKRTLPHVTEDISKSYVNSKINDSREALFREITGRDYGVDAIVEIFDDGMPTGKVAFLQIKATNEAIVPLRRSPEFVSCPGVSDSTLNYTYQNNIPVMLIYVYLKGERGFYFDIINNTEKKNGRNKTKKGDKTTIRLPVENHTKGDMTAFIKMINDYYNKKDYQ